MSAAALELAPLATPSRGDPILEMSEEVDDSSLASLLGDVERVFRHFLQLRREDGPHITVTVKQLTSATTNLGFRVSSRHENGKEVQYFMRVFGRGTSLLYSRARELKVMEIASRLDIGPHLYARFKNGIIVEFLKGRDLETHEVRTPARSAQIAREVARWHKFNPEQMFDSETLELISEDIFSMLTRWQGIAERMFVDHPTSAVTEFWQPVWPQLCEEIASMTHTLTQLLQAENNGALPPLVFSHNDLNPGNIMIVNDDSRLYFIDVETAALNYHPFDLGNYCNEWCGVLSTDSSFFPSESQQRAFIREYLLELHNGVEPTEKQLDVLWKEVHYFSLYSNLFWCVWAIIQGFHSHIAHFSHLNYSRLRWDRYHSIKEHFDIIPSPALAHRPE
jgi:ethanolamine kinase